MSELIEVVAQTRDDGGKGASRRLRRQGLVPGIVYGGHREPQMITLPHNVLVRSLEEEAFYSSLLDLKVGEERAKVVLKDLQRHPAKPFILHVDFQRVSMAEKLRMTVPLHFENEETAVGIKAGGKLSRNLTEVEITCLPNDLPEFITVDLGAMEIGDILHLSELTLPEGVELISTTDVETPVVLIHAGYSDTDAEDGEDGEAGGEGEAGAEDEEAS